MSAALPPPSASRVSRRAMDLLVAAPALALVGGGLLAVAALIKLTSPGPVFHSQSRIGLDGRPFRFFKFRTMYEGARGPGVTVSRDPRITPIGRLLRKTKVDELPQLLNVLRGDMTLIGPRPELERFVRRYSAEQRQVLGYRPGLASLSQLEFFDESERLRAYPDPEEAYVRLLMPQKIALDLRYEATRSVWSDIKLIGRILWLVCRGRPLGQRLEPDKEVIA